MRLWTILILFLFTIKPTQAAILTLEENGQKCQVNYIKAKKDRLQGSLLLLNDYHKPINDIRLLKPLRIALLDDNWTTISLMVKNNQDADTACIRAAVAKLKKDQMNPIFIATIGQSYKNAFRFLISDYAKGIFGLIMISPFPKIKKGSDEEKKLMKNWAKRAFPVLLIYNVRDFYNIKKTAEEIEHHYAQSRNNLLRVKKILAGYPGSIEYAHKIAKFISSWLFFVKNKIDFIRKNE